MNDFRSKSLSWPIAGGQCFRPPTLAAAALWLLLLTSSLLADSNDNQQPQSGAATAKSASGQAAATKNSTVPIGAQVDAFELMDYRGRSYNSSEFSSATAIALVFLGTECPLAKLYAGRASQLEREYRESGVVFLAINPNVQDSLEMMASFARRHELEIPFLKDPAQKLSDAVGATRTPEVCLLDGQRRLVYRGRIDDQWGIGYARDETTSTELKDALQAVLRGTAVPLAESPAQGCLIGRRSPSSGAGEVTFANQISRFIHRRCLECHRDGEIGPMDFTKYEDVAAWSDMMWEVISDRRMPPWHTTPEYGPFSNDRYLSSQEIEQFQKWVDAGTPLGDLDQLPETPTYTTGWQLPREPDLIISATAEPFTVPAKGIVQYQHFIGDLGLTEDKWVKAVEVRPGNRAVVHHILVFDRPKGSRATIMPHRSFFAGYIPGGRVAPLPDGMAKRLSAGSELVFQIHYTPIGTEQLDQSQIGIVFADQAKPLTHEVQTISVVDLLFGIPPHAASFASSAVLDNPLPECELLALTPHMHLRGKSYRYTAIFPNGNRRVLLDVPNYDFNWQTDYLFAEPVKLPEGTQILGEAIFDNSTKNLNNPDPSKWVYFGEQTWDEMMIGYMHLAIPVDPATGRARTSVLPHELKGGISSLDALFNRLDVNQDGVLSKAEAPNRVVAFFRMLDRNGDGVLSKQEFQMVDRFQKMLSEFQP
ncbi:MAG: redoxin domain-containing protein [Pirellulaceae bacterium]|nr:redoxin domain-containing protein [Pirellulaceae bacterium]